MIAETQLHVAVNEENVPQQQSMRILEICNY